MFWYKKCPPTILTTFSGVWEDPALPIYPRRGAKAQRHKVTLHNEFCNLQLFVLPIVYWMVLAFPEIEVLFRRGNLCDLCASHSSEQAFSRLGGGTPRRGLVKS